MLFIVGVQPLLLARNLIEHTFTAFEVTRELAIVSFEFDADNFIAKFCQADRCAYDFMRM